MAALCHSLGRCRGTFFRQRTARLAARSLQTSFSARVGGSIRKLRVNDSSPEGEPSSSVINEPAGSSGRDGRMRGLNDDAEGAGVRTTAELLCVFGRTLAERVARCGPEAGGTEAGKAGGGGGGGEEGLSSVLQEAGDDGYESWTIGRGKL